MFLQFNYEPHGFPLEKFETKAEAMASLDELCKRIITRRREKGRMLEKVLHDEKLCEHIMKVLKNLENLEFYINNVRVSLKKLRKKPSQKNLQNRFQSYTIGSIMQSMMLVDLRKSI
jgi:hypothetical protein